MRHKLTDDHGQPINRLYNQKRLNDRTIDELIGLSRGIISDGIINKREAEFLCDWMTKNLSFCSDPLINQLYRRIHEMLTDKNLDKDEQLELLEILNEFTGESTISAPAALSSSFPLCDPPPRIEFPCMSFCLTGKFAYGPRRICQEVVTDRGGKIIENPTLQLDYLVIGTFSSTDWIHTSYGRKIEKAVEYRERTGKLAIISEDCWARTAFAIWGETNGN